MTAGRITVSSGVPWEKVVGYARAVRAGDTVHVSGTVGLGPDGKLVGPDPAAQTRAALDNIRRALEEVGATLEDVVRTRMYVTDIRLWEAVGRAHGEVFGHIRPASTMVQVAALIEPGMVVEIEADAVVDP